MPNHGVGGHFDWRAFSHPVDLESRHQAQLHVRTGVATKRKKSFAQGNTGLHEAIRIDPLGRSTIPASSDNYFCTCCPSVRPLFKSSKTKQQKIGVWQSGSLILFLIFQHFFTFAYFFRYFIFHICMFFVAKLNICREMSKF